MFTEGKKQETESTKSKAVSAAIAAPTGDPEAQTQQDTGPLSELRVDSILLDTAALQESLTRIHQESMQQFPELTTLPPITLDVEAMNAETQRAREEFLHSLNSTQIGTLGLFHHPSMPNPNELIARENTFRQQWRNADWFQQAYQQNHHEAVQAYFELEDRPQLDSQIRLDALGADVEVPQEFICVITQQCMDDPVYVEGMPETHYDYRVIERWLQQSQTNPLTRAPLTLEQLIHNEELRERIAQFVTEAERTHQAQARPGSGQS